MFDDISQDDLIMAFFPCIRFEDQALLIFRCDQYQLKRKSEIEKLEIDIKAHEELHDLYILITKLAIICFRKGLKIIIENPYSAQHYLTRYWCLNPELIDQNRTERGDYYKKPTQFFFINCESKHNFIFEPLIDTKLYTVSNYSHDKDNKIDGQSSKVSRSMIHPQYANRFIREFIL